MWHETARHAKRFAVEGTMNTSSKGRRMYFTAVIAEHTYGSGHFPQTKPPANIKKGGVAKYGT
jgi:hypothetical protein